jgi:hypothetical protein
MKFTKNAHAGRGQETKWEIPDESKNPHHSTFPHFRGIVPVFVPLAGRCLCLADGLDLRGG